jgi:hypothetical protein
MGSSNLAAFNCTCGEDLIRNGGNIHNYACDLTPKCQHMVSKLDVRTGETIQVPCGSRLDHYIQHSFGCPLLPLCPHCGTSMDRRGVHRIDCPNRRSYLSRNHGNFRSTIQLSGGFDYLGYVHEQSEQSELRNFQNLVERFLNFMSEMPVILHRNPVLPPSIIDGDFEIKGQCSICFLECNQSERVLKPSGCDHCFHAHCLTPWIHDHSTCPNCRGKIQTILRKNL